MPDKCEKRKFLIFDTVVLSNFLLVDAEFILQSRYSGKAVITGQVYDEICNGVLKFPKLRKIERLISEKTFLLHSLTESEHKIYVEMIDSLGKGEASCIARAKTDCSVIATDDRAARKQCVFMTLPVTGTIGIFKAAVLSGQLELKDADDFLKEMIASGFYSPVSNISDII